LEAIAEQALAREQALWAVLDAHRGQVFAAHYRRDAAGMLHCLEGTALLEEGDWLSALRAGDTVCGPILSRLAPRLPTGVTAALPTVWSPSAVAVGRTAIRRFAAGERDDPIQLAPRYYRASAAEERRSAAGA
jgi:tRNA threonylcarbamoyladenosine biosynthesis protein TsaB